MPNLKYTILKLLKFIYSEKATKFCEIFTLLSSYVVPVKSKVKISQKFCGLLRMYELYQCNLKLHSPKIAKIIMPAKTEVEQFVMATKIASRFKLLLAGL